jgi:hypothetical protein
VQNAGCKNFTGGSVNIVPVINEYQETSRVVEGKQEIIERGGKRVSGELVYGYRLAVPYALGQLLEDVELSRVDTEGAWQFKQVAYELAENSERM